MLPNNPKPAWISELLANIDHWVGRLTPGSYSSDKAGLLVGGQAPSEAVGRVPVNGRAQGKSPQLGGLLELALEKESDQHLNAYCP